MFFFLLSETKQFCDSEPLKVCHSKTALLRIRKGLIWNSDINLSRGILDKCK